MRGLYHRSIFLALVIEKRHSDKSKTILFISLKKQKETIRVTKMKVELLAFDSMGVRSMCTFIETDDIKIIIDPGIAVGPLRFGLQPHISEQEKLNQLAKGITQKGKESDVIIISHYHYDHHDLGEKIPFDIYEDKTVLIKDPQNNINRSQLDFRAPLFLGILKEKAKKVEAADGKKFTFGKTGVEFSKAVFHGASNKMGYVIETLVNSGTKKVIHSSDVQGPIFHDQTEFIIKSKPDLAIVDGPSSYMIGSGYSQENMEAALTNLKLILANGLKELVLDHHLLRDLNYNKYIAQIGEDLHGKQIMTAAEYMGLKNELLEARRKELYYSI
jgi:predicted metallo-beta-lactamase superfamily hydrolase